MMRGNLKISFYLSIIATILAAIASGIGLFNAEIYNDNAFVKSAWYANDWVTLVVAVPSLIIALVLSKNGDFKPKLVWLGLMGYLFYNYAFYLFGAAFNNIFLLYVAIYTLSFFALIMGLAALPVQNIIGTSKILRNEIPILSGQRAVSFFLILISIMLCLVEIPPCFTFITKGAIPEIIVKTQIHTSIVYALDLSFVVPAMVLGAILLWQNKGWGIILSAMMLVKCFTYGLVLTFGTFLLMKKGLSNDPLLPVWIFITVGGLVGVFILLKNVKSNPLTALPKNL
ncbi:MAG: hypothetical protein LH615_13345 [Ferruginibacter sp.]|nr:hypothetical protein [Ferruginibacter sp.]